MRGTALAYYTVALLLDLTVTFFHLSLPGFVMGLESNILVKLLYNILGKHSAMVILVTSPAVLTVLVKKLRLDMVFTCLAMGSVHVSGFFSHVEARFATTFIGIAIAFAFLAVLSSYGRKIIKEFTALGE